MTVMFTFIRFDGHSHITEENFFANVSGVSAGNFNLTYQGQMGGGGAHPQVDEARLKHKF